MNTHAHIHHVHLTTCAIAAMAMRFAPLPMSLPILTKFTRSTGHNQGIL